MSFVITLHIPEGIVMASDSRQSVTIEGKTRDGEALPKVETPSSDHVYKIFLLKEQQTGIATFGKSVLGNNTVESHVKRFTEEGLVDEDDVATIPEKLLDFMAERFPQADTAFHVAGFRKEDKVSVPYVFACHVARGEIKRVNTSQDGERLQYGASFGGQMDVVAAILMPPGQATDKEGAVKKMRQYPIIWEGMTLQDAIDFSIYAVRTTIDTMRFQARPKNVGGPIDVLLLTPSHAAWIQRKELHGEA